MRGGAGDGHVSETADKGDAKRRGRDSEAGWTGEVVFTALV